jgi:AcrR family transcriptional regulator
VTRSRPIPDESRRSERARSAILDAAKHLVATVGYDKMTMDGIAQHAGVGKQTIYRWWRSKGAVVLDMWAPEVHPRLKFPNSGDLAKDMKTQLHAVVALGTDPAFGPSFRALVAESQHDEELASQLVARIFGPRIEACKERLRAAQDDGEMRTDVDLDVAIDLLYGVFYHRYLLRVAPLNKAAIDAGVEVALSGLRPARPLRPARRAPAKKAADKTRRR